MLSKGNGGISFQLLKSIVENSFIIIIIITNIILCLSIHINKETLCLCNNNNHNYLQKTRQHFLRISSFTDYTALFAKVTTYTEHRKITSYNKYAV